MERIDALRNWLTQVRPDLDETLQPASSDASFRRYFRVHGGNGETFIIMDAPPAQEDVRPWIDIAARLAEAGVCVPEIHAHDAEQGFILMSDLGTTTYLDALTPANAAALYADALGTLIALQHCPEAHTLPAYSRELLEHELRLFDTWYVERHKATHLDAHEREGLERVYARLLDTHLAEPRVFVHRDYHSRNLMHRGAGQPPGLIDFQDAVFGPISYDLVSLFKDAYILWDEEFVLDLLVRYWETARDLGLPVRPDFGDFLHDYDWMGVQRHLKVLGVFARLHHRDGKSVYLDDMPRVLHHLRRTCQRYSELKPLLRILDRLDPEEVGLTYGYTF